MHKTVTPAYGRDYKSAKAARADWDAGKDFLIQPEGRYCSKQDFPNTTINIRYNKLRFVTIVE